MNHLRAKRAENTGNTKKNDERPRSTILSLKDEARTLPCLVLSQFYILFHLEPGSSNYFACAHSGHETDILEIENTRLSSQHSRTVLFY